MTKFHNSESFTLSLFRHMILKVNDKLINIYKEKPLELLIQSSQVNLPYE